MVGVRGAVVVIVVDADWIGRADRGTVAGSGSGGVDGREERPRREGRIPGGGWGGVLVGLRKAGSRRWWAATSTSKPGIADVIEERWDLDTRDLTIAGSPLLATWRGVAGSARGLPGMEALRTISIWMRTSPGEWMSAGSERAN